MPNFPPTTSPIEPPKTAPRIGSRLSSIAAIPAASLSEKMPLAMWICLIYVFMLYSRICDYVLGPLHLLAVLLVLLAVATFATGAWRSVLTPVGLTYLFLSFWIALGVPFSDWRGGSFGMLKNFLIGSAVFIPIGGLPHRVKHLRAIMYTFALGTWFLVPFTFRYGRTGDRVGLEGGMYGNPNDLALILCLSLPFWWFILKDQKSRIWRALAFFVGVLPVLATLLKTGSRSGILGLALVTLVLFLRSSGRAKLAFCAIVLILAIGALVIVPQSLMYRYQTFTKGSGADEDVESEALGSTETRLDLLKDSIKYALAHPILGLGAGQFTSVRGKDRDALGLYGKWVSPHNAYTQMACECGFPAAFAYTGILIWTLVTVGRVRREAKRSRAPDAARIWAMATALEAAVISYAQLAFFLSIAYQNQLFTFAGMALAVVRLRTYLVQVAPVEPRENEARAAFPMMRPPLFGARPAQS